MHKPNKVTAGKKRSLTGRLAVVLAGIALLLATFGASARSAQAAVQTCDLAGLQAAVNNGGTQDLACSADTTITLDVTWNGVIATNLTLTNTGAGKVTINGNNLYQIFSVNLGKSLSLTNLNLTNGTATLGGAIESYGSVTVTNSTFYGNSAPSGYGGAIYNDSGSVTVTNSTFYGNSAIYSGAIYNNVNSSVTVTNSTFYGNSATNTGGAILNFGTLTISNSTMSGNSATSYGGAIVNYGGTVTLTNSTMSGNSATDGGAIYISSSTGSLTISNSTLSGNSATDGGAIWSFTSVVTLQNSLLQGNNICYNYIGGISITDGGYNLEAEAAGSYSCGFSGTSINTTDAKLGTLGDNGGATATIALLSGSPAIDAIPMNKCLVITDQRGISRPQGTGCDIGAFEVGQANPSSASDLIPQLRVSPSPVVAISPENFVSFSFKLKNIGIGSASYVRLEIPIPQGLEVGYLDGASAGVWVTQVTTATVTIALPSLAQNQEAHGSLVFRPNASAVVGTEVEARYKVVFDDEVGCGKSLNSNSQRFVFGETNGSEDGAIQRGAAISATVGEKVSLVQKGYLANEIVSLWYTKPDGTSVSLGEQRANANGEITIVVNTSGFAPGDYNIVGYGNRSEVTHVNILTVVAAS
ncbi:right-handed parallel beta-helix repeat-containing protein [Candidatus Chlorohelix allophototropha]|uniref:Right-handed parallel beta-helix repeat-containing protein n=2 Tax=Candidatus Chlorohelix allophototropha TaxID=3003348 RepID=A0ABY9B6A6_9CHLR|nr:right-handed parallel beta-helix repeat-containing protein [Chloroflexota bacterium L227-S17]